MDGDTIMVAGDSIDSDLLGAVGALYVFQWNGAGSIETRQA
jgi:hypothetical protein